MKLKWVWSSLSNCDQSLIKFDQVWTNKFDEVWKSLSKFEWVWSSLIKFDQVWSSLIKFDQVWSFLIKFWCDLGHHLIPYTEWWYHLTKFLGLVLECVRARARTRNSSKRFLRYKLHMYNVYSAWEFQKQAHLRSRSGLSTFLDHVRHVYFSAVEIGT